MNEFDMIIAIHRKSDYIPSYKHSDNNVKNYCHPIVLFDAILDKYYDGYGTNGFIDDYYFYDVPNEIINKIEVESNEIKYKGLEIKIRLNRGDLDYIKIYSNINLKDAD